MHSMVEGQVRRCVTLRGLDMRPVPLHQLRWSPSPFRRELSAISVKYIDIITLLWHKAR